MEVLNLLRLLRLPPHQLASNDTWKGLVVLVVCGTASSKSEGLEPADECHAFICFGCSVHGTAVLLCCLWVLRYKQI